MAYIRRNRLAVNHDAPLPMGYTKALARAACLREVGGMSWKQVSFIMSYYHGFTRTGGWWSAQVRSRNLVPPRPRGNGIRNLRSDLPPNGLRGYLAELWDGPGGATLDTHQ